MFAFEHDGFDSGDDSEEVVYNYKVHSSTIQHQDSSASHTASGAPPASSSSSSAVPTNKKRKNMRNITTKALKSKVSVGAVVHVGVVVGRSSLWTLMELVWFPSLLSSSPPYILFHSAVNVEIFLTQGIFFFLLKFYFHVSPSL